MLHTLQRQSELLSRVSMPVPPDSSDPGHTELARLDCGVCAVAPYLRLSLHTAQRMTTCTVGTPCLMQQPTWLRVTNSASMPTRSPFSGSSLRAREVWQVGDCRGRGACVSASSTEGSRFGCSAMEKWSE